AVCCRTLEGVYHDAGYPDEAVRYGELAARYEQSAETTVPLAAPSTSLTSAASTVGPPRVTPAIAARPFAASPIAVPPAAARPADIAAAAAPSAPWPMAPPPALDHEIAPAAHPEFAIPELAVHTPSDAHDLSSEWEHSLSVDEAVPAAELSATVEGEADADASSNPEIAETVEEIRFYLEHFMTDQARTGIEKLESLTSDARILDPLRAAVESAGQPLAEPEAEVAEINADEISADEINADEPADFAVEMEIPHGSEIAASPDLMGGFDHEIPRSAPAEFPPEPAYPEPAHAEPVHAEASDLNALVADLEASLGDAFPQAAPEPPAPLSPAAHPLPGWPVTPAPKRAAAPSVARTHEPEPEPVAHIEIKPPAAPAMPAIAASAGGAATAAAPAQVKASMSYSDAPVRPLGAGAQAMHASDSVDLSEMFGELKQELEEEVAAGDDDPETHYNLGVAFREMGLLDEAIAELQKVCNSIDRGKAFSQPVQTYTWLAQCFLDKGVPDAAIRWYEKALNIPGLDDEARLAINYELGSACETAMDKPAALRHFTSVYGSNIDYRDVAERIQALKS
ncbi:MAG: tetratricopeptide repeat protein, partial [Terriglobales bacterium]